MFRRATGVAVVLSTIQRLSAVSLLILLLCNSALATTISLPYVFVNGQTLPAAQLNGDYNAIVGVVNGNIDNTNIVAGAAIALNKLGAGPALNIAATSTQTWGSGTTGDTNPRITQTTQGMEQFGSGGVAAPDIGLKRASANALAIRDAGDTVDKGLTASTGTFSGAVAAANGSLSVGSSSGPVAGSITLYGSGSQTVTLNTQATAGNSTFTFPNSNGTNLQFLQTNGSGQTSWVTAGLSFAYNAKSASFSAVAGNAYGVDTSGGAVTCTLPTAASISGQEIVVWIANNGSNLTFNTTSAQTISGQASGAIVSGIKYNVYRFISDGANWILE